MIRTSELGSGETAYADAEWMPEGAGGPLPALVVGAGGIRWCNEAPVPLPERLDAAAAAALALLAVAREAVGAAAERPGRVEVRGSGLVAHLVRKLAGERASHDPEPRGRPAVVVETTGDPAAVVEATRSVADLGLVVLAGEPAGRDLDLNLYSDVHVRGLEVVGAPRPLRGRLADPEPHELSLLAETEPVLARLEPGEPAGAGGLWYAIAGS